VGLLRLIARHGNDAADALGDGVLAQHHELLHVAAVEEVGAPAELDRVLEGGRRVRVRGQLLDGLAHADDAHRVRVGLVEYGAQALDGLGDG